MQTAKPLSHRTTLFQHPPPAYRKLCFTCLAGNQPINFTSPSIFSYHRGRAMRKFLPLPIVILLVGCAFNPDRINAAHVPPSKYENHSCDRLAKEIGDVGQKTADLYPQLKKENRKDNYKIAGAWLIFSPLILALDLGSGPATSRYAQLKGEFEALRQNVTQKNCGFETKAPGQILKEAQGSG